jgi:hypothetical protein
MKPEIQTHPVVRELPQDFGVLRAEAQQEGYWFIERLAAECSTGKIRFDQKDEAMLISVQIVFSQASVG